MSTNLPDMSEPLVLADGTVIDPRNGKKVVDRKKYTEVPTHVETQQIIARTRRKLADLPAPPRAMNAISVALTYSLMGLDDDEIGVAMEIPGARVRAIRETAAYKAAQEAIVKSILEQDSENIRDLIQQHQREAIGTIVSVMRESEEEANRLVAARDLADRGGNRAADIIEHRHRMDGELVIQVIRRETLDELKNITPPMEK